MFQFILKILISSFLIASISELGKRNTFMASLLASLPITSLLAFSWLYYETRDSTKVIELCYSILLIVIPSLAFFLIFPMLLKWGMKFIWAISLASVFVFVIYLIYITLLKKFGVKL